MNPTLPPPADFATLAAVNGVTALRDHYSVASATLYRWERETGVIIARAKSGPQSNPRPADFEAVKSDLTIAELRARYGVARDVIRRWLREIGEVRTRGGRDAQIRKLTVARQNASSLHPVDRPHRDGSRAGMAAEFLRRLGPVFRCTASGRFDPKGTHWRRNSAVLTDDDLIERAVRNGWEPDAWARIAA